MNHEEFARRIEKVRKKHPNEVWLKPGYSHEWKKEENVIVDIK